MKNIKRALKVITLSLIFCISLSLSVFADIPDALIEIERYQQPSGGWQPGDIRNIKFTIKNNTSQKMTLSKLYMIEKSRTDLDLGKAFKEMAENTSVSIKDKKDNTLIENVLLSDFLATNGDSSLVNALKNSIILYSDQEVELTMEIIMNEKMGNDAQLLSKVFSLGAVYSLSDTGGGGDGGTVIPPIEPDEPIPPVEPPVEPPINPEPPVSPPITPEPGKPDGDKDDNNNNGSDVGGSEDKLPQTGGIINGATLTALGIGVAGLGIVLGRKSSDKGGNSDE